MTIDFELIRESAKNRANPDVDRKETLPGLIALLMDDLFRVPGTRWRFGLNPVLDLIPAIGDGAAALISGLTLFVAARCRVPKVVIARMALNILMNAVIGLLPGVGEAFAIWFRPSHRNYQLLKRHKPAVGVESLTSTKGDWAFVVAIVLVILVLFVACVGVAAYLFLRLLQGISGL